MLIVAALAAVYTRYGATPQAGWLLYGVQPVVIVIIAQALWNLGRRAVQDRLTAGVGAAVLFLYLLGINELGLLAAGGLLVMLVRNRDRRPPGDARLLVAPLAGGLLAGLRAVPFDLSLLFLTFLKIGSVLYGSGYVLLAFLRTDFVLRLGWLSERQLLDAVSIGQVTPGPVFTTATFTCWADCPGPCWPRWASFCRLLCWWPSATRGSRACAPRPGPGPCWMGSTWPRWA